jgi:1-phosphofructokinase family hexose kinase
VIVTVTLNPTLRVEYDAERVVPGESNRVRRVGYATGGRGLAVARYLQTFGHDVVAAGLAGGSAGELIRAELGRAGIAAQFTRIGAESRRVLAIADGRDGQLTSFTEPSPYITTEELGRLAADYLALLDGATAVVLCGSLPDGLPEEIYGSFVSYAAGAGVPVILDAGGSALRHAAARGPALVIPDDDGAGQAGTGPAALVRPDGPTSVVIMDGTAVRALTPAGEWQASQPDAKLDGEAVRDALVAGFVPGISLGWSWPDMLRHAAALAAAVQPSGAADLAAYETLLARITVTGPD